MRVLFFGRDRFYPMVLLMRRVGTRAFALTNSDSSEAPLTFRFCQVLARRSEFLALNGCRCYQCPVSGQLGNGNIGIGNISTFNGVGQIGARSFRILEIAPRICPPAVTTERDPPTPDYGAGRSTTAPLHYRTTQPYIRISDKVNSTCRSLLQNREPTAGIPFLGGDPQGGGLSGREPCGGNR